MEAGGPTSPQRVVVAQTSHPAHDRPGPENREGGLLFFLSVTRFTITNERPDD